MNYYITESADKEHVEAIKKALKENDGYCPCRIGKLPEYKCMCQEFRDELNDDSFEGVCHCGLYVKTLKEHY